MDLQAAIDFMNETDRATRSLYHLTLGEALKKLKSLPQDAPIVVDRGDYVSGVSSYRGFYADLALLPCTEPKTVRDVVFDLSATLGKHQEGWKGGSFLMLADTPLWVARRGEASDIAILDLAPFHGGYAFLTKKLRRYD